MKNIRIAKIMSRVASRLSAAALLAVLAGTLHADDWVYDNGTVSNGVWTFTAQLKSGTKVELTALTGGPSTLTALDFTKPIKDTSGNALSIGYFGRLMDAAAGQAFRPYVGELTLPASGYTGIGKNAFSWCVNATGTISLPGELTGMEGGEAFSGDSGITIVGNSFPSGLKEIYPSTFRKCKIQGDLELTYVEKINQFSFAETDVRAVTFGPALKEISNYSGDGAEGAFENCANLERVTFDPASSVSIYHGDTFCNCVSLTKLDLSPVVHIEQKADGVGHFRGCTSLKTVTFGSKLDYLDGRTFNGASALEMVVFKGPPPTTITNTYMYGLNRRVSTVVYLDPGATDYDYETAKAAWDDLTAGGEINYETSTWKSGYIGDVDASLRPLVLYSVSHVSIAAGTDADEGRGVVGSFTVSRGADDSLAGALVVNYTVHDIQHDCRRDALRRRLRNHPRRRDGDDPGRRRSILRRLEIRDHGRGILRHDVEGRLVVCGDAYRAEPNRRRGDGVARRDFRPRLLRGRRWLRRPRLHDRPARLLRQRAGARGNGSRQCPQAFRAW